MSRKYFTYYDTFEAALSGLSPADELALRRMIEAYGLRREDPSIEQLGKLTPAAIMAWVDIRKELEINWKRHDNGCKGGAPIGNRNAEKQRVTGVKNNQKQPKTTKNNQKQPKTTKNNQNSDAVLAPANDSTIIKNVINNNVIAHIESASAPANECVCVHEGLTPEERDLLIEITAEYNRYMGWLKKAYPYYANPDNCSILTLEQYHRLRVEFDKETIMRATEDLDGNGEYKRRGRVGSHFVFLRSYCENIKTKLNHS